MVDLPRFPLIATPSPLERVERLSAALGGRVDLWMKREDLLPIGFGGNKLRNLEYLIGAAIADGADALVTSGRRWTNHGRLTAAAGARAGLAVHVVVSGPPAVGGPGPGIRLMEAYGAVVHQLPTDDRAARAAAVDAVSADLRAAGRRPFVIEVGGSGMPGMVGQLDAMAELGAQVAATEPSIRPAALYLPTATGGTQAGLIARNATTTPPIIDGPIVGVTVARPGAELRPVIEGSLATLGAHLGVALPTEVIVLDDSQLGDGYGRPTPAAAEAADLLARTEAILVDPIYTAKALAGLVAAVRAGRHDGETIAFWHAGGTPGILEPLDA